MIKLINGLVILIMLSGCAGYQLQLTTPSPDPEKYNTFVPLVSAESTQPMPTSSPTKTSSPTSLPTMVPTPEETLTPSPGQYFTTLPPGSDLPGDAECAAAVKSRPENKGLNAVYNSTPGNQSLASDFFGNSDDPRANSEIAPRVSGNFTGTTDEILQWVACKWGIDEDIVRAQAALESWWHQNAMGDWTSDPNSCPPGHGLGVDGQPGMCPESWGVLQNRYPYEQSSWPGIADSTAFNVDTAYAIWRTCFEGYEWWLNDVDHGAEYSAGDAWGCIGRWFTGRWDTQPGNDYADRVKDYLNNRIWETAGFQEP